MITGKDFVFTGLQPWDIPIGSNARDIALEVSKHNRVLMSTRRLTRKHTRAKARHRILSIGKTLSMAKHFI